MTEDNSNIPLRRDLGHQLLVLYGLFVGLVLLAAVIFEVLASRQLQADIFTADLALAHAVAQESEITMANALETVRRLAGSPAVVAADPAGMAAIFSTVMSARSDINLTYRLDERGIMFYHYPEAPDSTVGVDFSFRDYFQRALTSREPLVSEGRVSPTTSEPVATAVMPLWAAGGRFLGVVATNMRLADLSYTLTSIAGQFSSDEQFQIAIIDASGQIVAHSNPDRLLADAGQGMPQIIEAVMAHQAGNRLGPDDSGQEQLYSYAPIENVGWGVVVSRPSAVAFATLTTFRRGIVVAAITFLAGGALFWLALSRWVIRPLERLATFSQNIGLADRSADSYPVALEALTSRPDQMGVLTRSLTRMQQAIEARVNELATLLDTSAAVTSSLDSQTVLDRILEQVERLLDIEMSAIFALDEAQGIFRVYASRGMPQWYTEQAVIAPDEPSSVTMRAVHSGQPIQISDTETNPSFKAYRERARAAGFRSVLAVPLPAQHTPAAALLVFRPDVHTFSRREINLVSNFANHATMAIENAALYARSDMRLQEQTRRLEALIQSMQDGLILEDLNGRVLYANRRIQELGHLTGEEIQGRAVTELMDHLLAPAEDKAAIKEAIEAALDDQGQRRVEFALNGSDRVRYLRLTLFDVTDPDGLLIGRGRILQDITQRHELDRMKSNLISTVSHELRTPLAAIKGYTTTLLAEDVEWDPQSQHEFLNIISVETDHLNDLVNDLLDMSRIEAGNLRVNRVVCDLPELIQQAALRAHPRPADRLQVALPADLPPLYADPQRIEAVLRNLIENATKYGGPDTPVRVTAGFEPGQGRLVVRVEDEGPGIPEEYNQRIFSSFFRVDNGLTRKTTGAGLGLAISRGFVQAHGGDIWLEPRPKGLCVAFSLPLVVEEADEP